MKIDSSLIKPIAQLVEYENELRKPLGIRRVDSTHGYFETPFLFRGQPDENEIVATQFRGKIGVEINTLQDLDRDFRSEYEEVSLWISRANKAGLQFNFDIWNYVNRHPGIATAFILGGASLVSHFPALSLSRHNGCRNRLIDFTKDHYAGLFFALMGALEKLHEKYLLLCNDLGGLENQNMDLLFSWAKLQKAVVWVIEETKINNCEILYPDFGNNKFAHAQSALFILAPYSTNDPEFSVQRLIFSENLGYYGFKLQRVFHVSYDCVPHLLIEMERFGMNLIKYFPSFETISRNQLFMNKVIKLHNIFIHS
jgi:hypothetical protein